MRYILQLLYQYRSLLLFLALELICFGMIVTTNPYQNSSFFNSSNAISGGLASVSNRISSYFYLDETNEHLVDQNIELLQEIDALKKKVETFAASSRQLNALKQTGILDSIALDSLPIVDASLNPNKLFNYHPAQVVKNEVRLETNYLTINKGRNDGIKPQMGVISPTGVVGQVVSCSGNYSLVMSLLNIDFHIASQLKHNKVQGSMKWDAEGIRQSHLLYIPRHVKLSVGDTVVTSGLNTIFPEGIAIGTVSKAELEQYDTFYDADVELITDFSSLDYVYIVDHFYKPEIDSLNQNRE